MKLGRTESGQDHSEATSGQPNPVVRASGLSTTYSIEGGWIRVLRGLDIEIAQGEFVAVVGPPNSGKSTLLSLIGGLTKPTRGTVYIEDHAITRLSRWERSRVRGRSVGFLFQQPKLLPDLSILENVLLPMRYLSRRERLEGRKHAVELLERVGLTGEMSLNPRKLTEEQRYRAALARALVNHPVVLLADDPFTALDSGEQQELMRLTHRLCREERCALLCTAEDEESISRADRVLVLPEPEIVHKELPGNLGSESSVASRTNQDLLSDLKPGSTLGSLRGRVWILGQMDGTIREPGASSGLLRGSCCGRDNVSLLLWAQGGPSGSIWLSHQCRPDSCGFCR